MTFNFTTQMTLDHLLVLPMPMIKKLECHDHQIYSKLLRKICKSEFKPQFHQSHKKFIFRSTFSICIPYGFKTFLKIIW